MKFTVAAALLLAGSAIAAPGTAMRRARALARKSNTMIQSDGPAAVAATNNSFVEYSSNWAGAVLIGTGYTSVTGTFTVPTPTTTGSGSAWVGIDGDTCGTAILQTGIDWTRSSSGTVTYDAWYEWYPDYAYDFTGITISAGDSITVTVTETSTTGGTAVVKNNTKGTSVTHTFTKQTGQLCLENAEWIVEDFEENNALVTFADFSTVTFTAASAIKSGTSVGTTGATIIDIEQNNKVLTDCSLVSSSSVKCTYV